MKCVQLLNYTKICFCTKKKNFLVDERKYFKNDQWNIMKTTTIFFKLKVLNLVCELMVSYLKGNVWIPKIKIFYDNFEMILFKMLYSTTVLLRTKVRGYMKCQKKLCHKCVPSFINVIHFTMTASKWVCYVLPAQV